MAGEESGESEWGYLVVSISLVSSSSILATLPLVVVLTRVSIFLQDPIKMSNLSPRLLVLSLLKLL